MSGDSYSRFVLILKVVLPLVGLAILSTLFLFSSRIEPGRSIPFAEGEITDRVRGQQVTGPFFSGVTTNGDKVTFRADRLATAENKNNVASDVSAQMDFSGGGSVALVASRAELDLAEDLAILSGDILVESTTGYKMRSDVIHTRLSELDVSSQSEVHAIGPAGTLTAGAMRIFNPENASGAQLLFSGGVKLIYDPKDPNWKTSP